MEKLNRVGISNEKFPRAAVERLLAAELIEAVPLRGYKITMKGQLHVTRQRMRVKYHQKEVSIQKEESLNEKGLWPWLNSFLRPRSE